MACDNLTKWVQALVVSQLGYSRVICPARVCSVLRRLQLALNAANQIPHHAGALSFLEGDTHTHNDRTVEAMEKATSK